MATNAGKRKPYQIQRGEQASDIDAMFEQLYRRLAAVEEASGSGEVEPNPLLDGDQHEDTEAGTPETGDIITAQSDKWARKAKGDDGQVLAMVSGEPEWSNDGSALTGVPTTPHNVLSSSHADSVAANPVLGDLIVAIRTGAGAVDHGQYWLAGAACDILPTSLDPGGVRFWFEGAPLTSIASAGEPKWQRLPRGSAGQVLKATALGVEWADP